MSEIIIDPSTGLPKLPKVYFWKFEYSDRNYYNDYDAYQVAIYKKRFLFRSPVRVVSRTLTGDNYFDFIRKPRKEDFLQCSMDLFTSWNDEIKEEEELSSLLGSYPPKKLGN